MEQPDQKWRIYAPQGRDTHLDTKMNLRTSCRYSPFLGRGEIIVSPVAKDDYGDDAYLMKVNEEKVAIVAREKGQRSHVQGLFDDIEAGIFYLVSDKNERDAESRLVKAFL
jgi:hypothetical protein